MPAASEEGVVGGLGGTQKERVALDGKDRWASSALWHLERPVAQEGASEFSLWVPVVPDRLGCMSVPERMWLGWRGLWPDAFADFSCLSVLASLRLLKRKLPIPVQRALQTSAFHPLFVNIS